MVVFGLKKRLFFRKILRFFKNSSVFFIKSSHFFSESSPFFGNFCVFFLTLFGFFWVFLREIWSDLGWNVLFIVPWGCQVYIIQLHERIPVVWGSLGSSCGDFRDIRREGFLYTILRFFGSCCGKVKDICRAGTFAEQLAVF
jgi:hypothetical protein